MNMMTMKKLILAATLFAGMMTAHGADVAAVNDFALPADFKPSSEEQKTAWFLGVLPSQGCEFAGPGGLRPIYVMQLPTGTITDDPLKVGDVIVAVGGAPLVKNSVYKLREAMEAARIGIEPVAITRWRDGKVEPVTFDLRKRPPDLLAGEPPDESHDWLLGPTGARGWIFTHEYQSEDARQILVTAVAKGSPAEGLLSKDDVILGVGERPFDGDARLQFANAITMAETKKGGGVLKLIRWRAGKTEDVTLQLKVMGAYSDTAPFDCPKSKKIFEQGCQAIAGQGLATVSMANDLNALALLASGKAEYQPLLAEYAGKSATMAAESTGEGRVSWPYGYANIFLTEYVLATGDQSVLPGVKQLALLTARGQSAVGTWGHMFARPDGNLNGYGCMNQPGLSLLIAMVLAREAGVHDPDLDRAISRGAGFLRWYVNKGAIPYGDHQPYPAHEDNGKCSSGAVLFDVLGDREAATFFAKMSAAAYDEREHGHTGNFFNILWALPGVSRCGPLATAAYWKEQAWYYELARGWDGSFDGKYRNWNCTGAYLLAYAVPLKSLYLTGRKKSSVPALNRKEVAEVIAAGRDFFQVKGKNRYYLRTTEELLAGLASWSPAVRKRSAQALGRREGDFVPGLLTLLASSDRNTRYGACEALGCLGPRADAAAPQLRALLADPDPWLQSLACHALPNLGPEARRASVDDLLRMATRINPADPRRIAQRAVGIALFKPFPGTRKPVSILTGSLDGVDRQWLYPAVRSLLENEDSVPRGAVSVIFGRLSDRDLAELLPDILEATGKLAPSNEMFADGVRLAGLDLLSRLHIREGMNLCVSTIESRWGNDNATRLEYLKRYGVHAKEYLPQLRQMNKSEALDKAIVSIESTTNAPPLMSVKEFVEKSSVAVYDSKMTDKETK